MSFPVWLGTMVAGMAVGQALPRDAAAEADLGGFFIEVPVGLATPVADRTWEGNVDPSFVTGVHFGYLFGLGGWAAAIGPEVAMTYSPSNVEDEEWGRDGSDDDVYIGRLRLTGGARFVIGFGSAFMFGRLGVGLDYVHANWEQHIVDPDDDTDDSDTGVALLIGTGLGYMITDVVGISMLLEYPIGFHDRDRRGVEVDLDGDKVDFLAALAVSFRL